MLLPYPLPETIQGLLDDLPSVMTLAPPHSAEPASASGPP
jgi:hypothetical protein